jgi:hypothetical protein
VPRPDDRVRLVFPSPAADKPDRVRWWWIRQPPPSVAFALQARIAAAVGDAAQHALAAFFTDDEQEADFKAERDTLGEALALRTLRRARAGKALFGAEDPVSCSDRLWAVLRFAQAKSGGTMDALTLMGEPERAPRSPEYKWPRASLLHRVLLASELRFDGEGDQPRGPLPAGPLVAPEPPTGGRGAQVAYVDAHRLYMEDTGRAALRDAVSEGSVTAFVSALDAVACSPDEVALLCAWAVLHLWRPF